MSGTGYRTCSEGADSIVTEDHDGNGSPADVLDPRPIHRSPRKPVEVPGTDRHGLARPRSSDRDLAPSAGFDAPTGRLLPPREPACARELLETTDLPTPAVVARYLPALPSLGDHPAENSNSFVNLAATVAHRPATAPMDGSDGASWRILSWSVEPELRAPRRRTSGRMWRITSLGFTGSGNR
jgi:hypothetical protein